MQSSTAAAMPARDAVRFRRAVSDFRGPDAPLPLAAVVLGAHGSGWSYRTIARSLELSRERTMQLASLRAEPFDGVARYQPGADFPAEVINEFRRRSEKVTASRGKTKARAAATVKAAHDAGWSYPTLAVLVGLSDEAIRKIAAEASPGISVSPFAAPPQSKTPPARTAPGVLSTDEATKMAVLAAVARTSSKNTGRSLGPSPSRDDLAAVERAVRARRASEELSDMIIAARGRNVPWADLDAACGYSTGAARARAVRHGYGSLPPTRKAYQRDATPVDTSA